MLEALPGLLDSFVAVLVADRVVLHPLRHALGHELASIALEDIDGDGESDLDQQDESHQGGIGVEHAGWKKKYRGLVTRPRKSTKGKVSTFVKPKASQLGIY